MAEYGVIYLATNRINGKQYVGKTARSMLIRKMFHEHHARKGVKTAFYHAIRKYGAESFDWKAVRTHVPVDELDEAERDSIRWYGTMAPNGYNMTEGGTGGAVWSGPHTEESKRKMREAVDEVTLASIKKKVSDSWKDPEIRSKRLSRMKGAQSLEVRRAVSERTRKMWANPEMRKERIEAINKAFSMEEVKQKHRAGLLRALAVPGFLENRGKAISRAKQKKKLERENTTVS